VSLRHGIRCVPAQGITVEDVLLAVGEKVGYENLTSASRMNKAVVVFVEKEDIVNQLVSDGIVVSGDFLIISLRLLLRRLELRYPMCLLLFGMMK
jgi:hypothetical protein